MIKCSYCGRENDDTCRFCGGCGAELVIDVLDDYSFENDPRKYINNPFDTSRTQSYNNPFGEEEGKPISARPNIDSNREQSKNYSNNVVPNAAKLPIDPVCMSGFVISLFSVLLCGAFSLISLAICIAGLFSASKSKKRGSDLAAYGIIISIIMIVAFFSIISFASRNSGSFSIGRSTTHTTQWYE